MKKYSAWIAAFAVAFVVVDVLLRVTGAGNHSSDEEQPIEPANQANQSKKDASEDATGQPGPQGGLSKPEKTDNAIPVNQDGGNNEGFTNESATGNTD